MRLTAYVLAGDPWWIEESIQSYYSAVDRIIVSYDEDGLSWTGTPLPVDECLDRIRSIDVDNKCEFVPGHYAFPDRPPMDNETAQRIEAVRAASPDSDWVLQLDTDEVIGDLDVFLSCLDDAEQAGARGLDYPARYLYARTRGGRFLEASTRSWRVSAGFPGPVAVRAGTTLDHARQADVPLFRVDFRPNNTDTHRPRDIIVHRVIPLAAGIRHYSWVRSVDYMRRKAGWSGHSELYLSRYGAWEWRRLHPLLTALGTPFAAVGRQYRLTGLPKDERFWVGER